MSELLAKVSARYVKPKFTDVKSGDTVRVYTRIKEGNKERTQFFEGVVIRRRGGIGTSATFTVRRIASGVGVERTFPLHSPTIERIQVQRGAKVRRAQLHYLRGRTGKAARLTEQPVKQADRDAEHPWPKAYGVEHKEMKAVEEVADESQLKEEAAEGEAAASEEKAEAKGGGKADAAEAKQKSDGTSEAKGTDKADSSDSKKVAKGEAKAEDKQDAKTDAKSDDQAKQDATDAGKDKK